MMTSARPNCRAAFRRNGPGKLAIIVSLLSLMEPRTITMAGKASRLFPASEPRAWLSGADAKAGEPKTASTGS